MSELNDDLRSLILSYIPRLPRERLLKTVNLTDGVRLKSRVSRINPSETQATHAKSWTIPRATGAAAVKFFQENARIINFTIEFIKGAEDEYLAISNDENIRNLKTVSNGECAYGDLVTIGTNHWQFNDSLYVFNGSKLLAFDSVTIPGLKIIPNEFVVLNGFFEFPIDYWYHGTGRRISSRNNFFTPPKTIVWLELSQELISEISSNEQKNGNSHAVFASGKVIIKPSNSKSLKPRMKHHTVNGKIWVEVDPNSKIPIIYI